MRVVFVVFIIISAFNVVFVSCAVTEAQLKSGGKLLRKNCQPKTKTSDESIENMHKGIWDDEPTTKCYTFCLMSFYKLVNKKGLFEEEYALSQLEMLPQPRQQPTWASAQKCKDKSDCCTDKCERAYAMMKCVYFDNPENYFAP
ncbi:general odorant-binding protein 72-like [Atheta coriaria]|uniref:general odorant-binding protein 72-like n=1 Tax=Dalotia coriaria TaxID=877792 RepID=UPI0031F3EB07